MLANLICRMSISNLFSKKNTLISILETLMQNKTNNQCQFYVHNERKHNLQLMRDDYRLFAKQDQGQQSTQPKTELNSLLMYCFNYCVKWICFAGNKITNTSIKKTQHSGFYIRGNCAEMINFISRCKSENYIFSCSAAIPDNKI